MAERRAAVSRPERWDRRAYLRLRRWRDRGARVAVAPLARVGARPWMVSAAGVIFAGSTLWTLGSHPRWALAAFLAALVCDALDGALARHLGCAGAYGKLIDSVCDTATLGVLVSALVRAGLAPPGRALAAVAWSVLALVGAFLYRRRLHGPGGGRCLEGGFFVHLPRGLLYGALAIFLLGGPQYLAVTLWLFNLLAAGAALGYLLASRIARQAQAKRGGLRAA